VARRDALRTAVESVLGHLRRQARRTLHNRTALSRRASDAVVAAAFERWDRPRSRTRAVANGTLARAAAVAVDRRLPDASPHRTDRLETALGTAFESTLRSRIGTVPERRVATVADRIRETPPETSRRARATLPAGLPVAPVPGNWYATVNVWEVSVQGAYARFTLRTDWGTEGPEATAVRYVRDGSAVSLDVDGDGDTERLGRDERIAFDTGTVVAVAVPSPDFVGDTEGGRNESTEGWPGPRCTSWQPAACPD
jgi:hypothetical protein